MTIKNESDLKTQINTDLANNTEGAISPADVRNVSLDLLDSLQSYAGVMQGGAKTGFTVSDVSPTEYPVIFDTDATPTATAVLEADQTNNQIKVFANARYQVTLRIQGTWTANKDLTFYVYVNGAPNALTALAITEEGLGDSQALSFTNVTFLINNSMLISQGDGTYASVKLYLQSESTPFTYTQTKATFGLSYGPLSIDTIPG